MLTTSEEKNYSILVSQILPKTILADLFSKNPSLKDTFKENLLCLPRNEFSRYLEHSSHELPFYRVQNGEKLLLIYIYFFKGDIFWLRNNCVLNLFEFWRILYLSVIPIILGHGSHKSCKIFHKVTSREIFLIHTYLTSPQIWKDHWGTSQVELSYLFSSLGFWDDWGPASLVSSPRRSFIVCRVPWRKLELSGRAQDFGWRSISVTTSRRRPHFGKNTEAFIARVEHPQRCSPLLITEGFLPGRGSCIALGLGWPLRLPQTSVTRPYNFW